MSIILLNPGCPIVVGALTRKPEINVPAERKCYKCHLTKSMKHFAVALKKDKCNRGYTYACKSCLRRDLLGHVGGFGEL